LERIRVEGLNEARVGGISQPRVGEELKENDNIM